MSQDEEYLISQVLNNMKTNVALAKSWMIFSKSVDPESFSILFQYYKMECEESNLTESAMSLSRLVEKFPKEPTLIKELKEISKALCAETDNFLKQIFEKLPEDTKQDVMVAVTRSAQSIEEHCTLMLLFLKRMPNSKCIQHGSNIIDTLLGAEERPGVPVPINLFRKMLVCEALPLMLKVPQFDYKFKVIFQLLQKSLEFYVCCMLTCTSPQEAAIRKEIFSHSDGNPDDGWTPLFQLMELVAIRYRWNYPEMFVSNFSELSLQQLISLLKRKNKTIASLSSEKHRREEMSGYEEAYFCLVVTFFYYLYRFGKIVLPKMPSTLVAGPYNFFLMEGIAEPQENCPRSLSAEFKRTDRGYVVVSKYANQEAASMLIPSFVTAVECWGMLHRHQHLMKEFKNLCKNIQLETWPVFQEFYINMLIYERGHRDAIEHLSRVQNSTIDPSIKNKSALQIASCYYFLSDHEHCLKILFDVVMNLPTSTNQNVVAKPTIAKCPARYMYFMGYNNREILQYCISMLLKLYKYKDNVDETYKDMHLGNMLVLMQYDLVHEYELLQKCMESIKKSKSFVFHKFFNYVINAEILEEMSSLAFSTTVNVNLEILSTPTFQASKQRAVTRGVNKGAKDDLKQAFINQMTRFYENVDNVFIDFIKEEHNFLLLPLSDGL